MQCECECICGFWCCSCHPMYDICQGNCITYTNVSPQVFTLEDEDVDDPDSEIRYLT